MFGELTCLPVVVVFFSFFFSVSLYECTWLDGNG